MLRNKKLRNRIEKVLIEHPHCRDDDMRLIQNIWQQELVEKVGLQNYSNELVNRRKVIQEVASLSSPEAIRRMRQKIQELTPSLRGESYKDRQKHQATVKQELRDF